MCIYQDFAVIHKGCFETPRHVLTLREYLLCNRSRSIGTDTHCSDEHARALLPGAHMGSLRVPGPCATCANPQRTIVIARSHALIRGNKLTS